MSWLEGRLAPVVALACLLGLVGCQVRPLYSATPTEAGPQTDLPAISVAPPVTREEQVYRNALLFGLRGGSEGADPRYNLVYRMTIREQAVLIERGSGTPNIYQLTGGVSFLVKDAATGTSLFGSNVTSINSYSRSSQNFANIRARRDAEDRLAKTLADLTRTRLAAYFATN